MVHTPCPNSSNNQLSHNNMYPLFLTLGAVVVLPYVLLAVMFLLIGEAARTRGLFELIDVVANHALWIFRWGIYGLPLLWLVLIGAGFFPRLQRGCSLFLLVTSLSSLLVICFLHSARIGLGEFTFLLPCIAVLGLSVWLFIRMGAAA